MTGDLYINGKDAYTKWGAFMEDGGLAILMTPPPMKDYITNDSPNSDGISVATTSNALPKVKDRDMTLTLCIRATTMTQFLANYTSFVTELQGGTIEIKTKYQPDVVYRCLYASCQQFSQYDGRIGKFALKLNEPNPKDRGV